MTKSILTDVPSGITLSAPETCKNASKTPRKQGVKFCVLRKPPSAFLGTGRKRILGGHGRDEPSEMWARDAQLWVTVQWGLGRNVSFWNDTSGVQERIWFLRGNTPSEPWFLGLGWD